MKHETLIFFLALLCVSVSCTKDKPEVDPASTRKTFIMYSCGFNNLMTNLRDDIGELARHAPFKSDANYHKLLIFSHLSVSNYDYDTPVSPVLMDVYRTSSGTPVMDTLLVFPPTMSSADSRTLHTVLCYIKEKFPSKEYGFMLSSHATGWLPQGYYSHPEDDDIEWTYSASLAGLRRALDRGENAREYMMSANLREMPSSYDDVDPLVKTVCASYSGTMSKLTGSAEIEIENFVGAFPMHMRYMIFDACLMGGVEVAYQLRNVTDCMVFSQTEVLSDGFEYETVLDDVLFNAEPDVEAVARDYYNHYKSKGSSASVSLVDCSELEALSQTCSTLFEKYRDRISAVKPSLVQGYFRYGKHWFYDLRDILAKAGVSEEDMASFDQILSRVVKYKAATNYVLGIKIVSHSGLSMYLPCDGTKRLNDFYRGYDWNKATSLVK